MAMKTARTRPAPSSSPATALTAEHERLRANIGQPPIWWKWGPYVSERAWGTVREDYSATGEAWDFLPHDMARSKAYRWGEDGLAGICDRYQLLVFALALWNERDPILKERAYGLVPNEGNHGEDVKEYYFYLDSTPTHSYMKYLYKYPQAPFPYSQLIQENRRRSAMEPEYELLDTGLFDDQRYFDIVVEYAKASPEDICIRIQAFNRGKDAAPLHLLPHLWFRNTWAWAETRGPEPVIELSGAGGRSKAARTSAASKSAKPICLIADDGSAAPLPNLTFTYRLGRRFLYAQPGGRPLFTNNETNMSRVFGPDRTNHSPFVKDAFHRHLIDKEDCINPALRGTKACVDYRLEVPAGGSFEVLLRWSPVELERPLEDVPRIIRQRAEEADRFYDIVHPPKASPQERQVQRQALAGLLWSKQIYLFDVDKWLDGDSPAWPPPAGRKWGRNAHWRHLNSMRILSMPDKWEYPWFAAWDLAFQAVALAVVDTEFAKEQLWLLLFEQFQHPNGQIPAYEWAFSDMNPPVHAWAAWRVYNMEKRRHGRADRDFLERCFHKLLMNFSWWVNKVDSQGNNVFEGGFLGLDNITVVDRSERLPGGTILEQADATGWMAMFCLNMVRIALELAVDNKVYERMATKFLEHFMRIGAAMKNMGQRDHQLWDADDSFFYDVLRYPDGSSHKFRVRSLVGLIPLYAVERLQSDWLEPFPEFRTNLQWFLKNRPELASQCCHVIERDGTTTYALTLVDESQMKTLLQRVWDEDEFLSDYGIRSLSKAHRTRPFRFGDRQVGYEPGDAHTNVKGGNSNWRGPIWFPTGFLLVESLRKLGQAFGPSLTVSVREVGGAVRQLTLRELAGDLAARMSQLFVSDERGYRPMYGERQLFQRDPHWKDCLLFYEFFHGDTGVGLGASHQTGWTGLVASLIDEWKR